MSTVVPVTTSAAVGAPFPAETVANTILTPPLLARLWPPGAVQEITALDDFYLQSMIDAVEDEMARWLKFDPRLTVRQGESGVATLIKGGQYQGRYHLELAHAPLLDGPATAIFQSLALTYAAALVDPSQVALAYVQADRDTADVWCLAPGVPEGLAGTSYGFGDTAPSVSAVGYQANYVAGYATGLNDPVPGGGGQGFTGHCAVLDGKVVSATVDSPGWNYQSPPILTVTGGAGGGAQIAANLWGDGVGELVVACPGLAYTSAPTIAVSSATSFRAPPLPPSFRRAAVLLVREALAFDFPLARIVANPLGGQLIHKGTTQGQSFTYDRLLPKDPEDEHLGFNTQMSQGAERLLTKWRKRRYFTLLS